MYTTHSCTYQGSCKWHKHIYNYIYRDSTPWESNYRDGPTGHKKTLHIQQILLICDRLQVWYFFVSAWPNDFLRFDTIMIMIMIIIIIGPNPDFNAAVLNPYWQLSLFIHSWPPPPHTKIYWNILVLFWVRVHKTLRWMSLIHWHHNRDWICENHAYGIIIVFWDMSENRSP